MPYRRDADVNVQQSATGVAQAPEGGLFVSDYCSFGMREQHWRLCENLHWRERLYDPVLNGLWRVFRSKHNDADMQLVFLTIGEQSSHILEQCVLQHVGFYWLPIFLHISFFVGMEQNTPLYRFCSTGMASHRSGNDVMGEFSDVHVCVWLHLHTLANNASDVYVPDEIFSYRSGMQYQDYANEDWQAQ